MSYEALLVLLLGMISAFAYPILIILFVLTLGLGAFSWVVIIICLSPPTVAWIAIGKKREENSIHMALHGAGLTYERMEKARDEWIKKQQQKKEEPLKL